MTFYTICADVIWSMFYKRSAITTLFPGSAENKASFIKRHRWERRCPPLLGQRRLLPARGGFASADVEGNPILPPLFFSVIKSPICSHRHWRINQQMWYSSHISCNEKHCFIQFVCFGEDGFYGNHYDQHGSPALAFVECGTDVFSQHAEHSVS